ncbi:MAG TPA: aminotransferase class I/II-fold pyridoxal phosphate-dependent enzyme [Candidatus Limnocylindria bacterium]|nr:aminotransferase class I/II-fold pyridoxal phosphate-dependent enzyme [Candidatus Limnocylindria bacterium]
MTRVAARAETFTESVIRDMTRLALRHDAVNLAQGFPDFACPPELKEAACAAIHADLNQYAITWGAPDFRQAIAAKTSRFYPNWQVDPDAEITVTCGATEGMIAAMLALLDPTDEVIVFEPFYENYGPDAILSGARPRYVTLHEPDWHFDPAELRAAFGSRTKAIVVNNPHNPTGKVFSRAELGAIADLCHEHDVIALTDEIYEHIVYDADYIPLATLPGMRQRTVAINSLSKTYSVTGWRVGWVIAPPDLTGATRKVHDFLTVGAAAPLQAAGTVALNLPDTYYDDLAAGYRQRRDLLVGALETAGFRTYSPQGAYYVMTDIGGLSDEGDVAFARRLTAEVRVAPVPGSSFYSRPELGRSKVRFAFPKRLETLRGAARRLTDLGSVVGQGL